MFSKSLEKTNSNINRNTTPIPTYNRGSNRKKLNHKTVSINTYMKSRKNNFGISL